MLSRIDSRLQPQQSASDLSRELARQILYVITTMGIYTRSSTRRYAIVDNLTRDATNITAQIIEVGMPGATSDLLTTTPACSAMQTSMSTGADHPAA